MTVNALAAADELLIPAAASAYTEDGVRRTWEAYQRTQASYNAGLRAPRILVTRVKHTNASGVVLDGLTTAYKQYVIPQVIAESTAVDEAEQLHLPVVVYDPASPTAKGFMRVAEILEP
jgi:chromosome partitioning protein